MPDIAYYVECLFFFFFFFALVTYSGMYHTPCPVSAMLCMSILLRLVVIYALDNFSGFWIRLFIVIHFFLLPLILISRYQIISTPFLFPPPRL